jgi:hypothetical protein
MQKNCAKAWLQPWLARSSEVRIRSLLASIPLWRVAEPLQLTIEHQSPQIGRRCSVHICFGISNVIACLLFPFFHVSSLHHKCVRAPAIASRYRPSLERARLLLLNSCYLRRSTFVAKISNFPLELASYQSLCLGRRRWKMETKRTV